MVRVHTRQQPTDASLTSMFLSLPPSLPPSLFLCLFLSKSNEKTIYPWVGDKKKHNPLPSTSTGSVQNGREMLLQYSMTSLREGQENRVLRAKGERELYFYGCNILKSSKNKDPQ